MNSLPRTLCSIACGSHSSTVSCCFMNPKNLKLRIFRRNIKKSLPTYRIWRAPFHSSNTHSHSSWDRWAICVWAPFAQSANSRWKPPPRESEPLPQDFGTCNRTSLSANKKRICNLKSLRNFATCMKSAWEASFLKSSGSRMPVGSPTSRRGGPTA